MDQFGNTSPVVRAGRFAGNPVRGFVAFLRAPVPPNATVLNATLVAGRVQIGNPYPAGQTLWLEATPWAANGLDAGDFVAANLAGTTPVAAATAAGTNLVVDVTPLVQAYVNLGATTVDFRFRMQIEGAPPLAFLNDCDQVIAPQLQVTFIP